MNKLKKRVIGSQVHYIPLQLQPFYQDTFKGRKDLKCSENYYEKCLSIPLYYSLSSEDQKYVIETITELVN